MLTLYHVIVIGNRSVVVAAEAARTVAVRGWLWLLTIMMTYQDNDL